MLSKRVRNRLVVSRSHQARNVTKNPIAAWRISSKEKSKPAERIGVMSGSVDIIVIY
jgi:hypothetical protein